MLIHEQLLQPPAARVQAITSYSLFNGQRNGIFGFELRTY